MKLLTGLMFVLLAISQFACGGGGGGGGSTASTPATVTGVALPTQVSAVTAK